MRKILVSAALATGLALAATPASAQFGSSRHNQGYHQGGDVRVQLQQIRERIDHLYSRRLISDNEARRLSRESRHIEELFYRYRRNGLTQGEHHDLMRRIQNLRQQVRAERREGRQDRWDDRRDDRQDRWEDRRDDRRDRWEDRRDKPRRW
jgi:hypothetical protein